MTDTCRVTGGLSIAVISRPGRRPGRIPTIASGLHPGDLTTDDTLRGGGEVTASCHLNSSVSATVTAGAGSVYRATQAAGVDHSYPFDVPEAFLETAIRLDENWNLVLWGGRRYSTMSGEVTSPFLNLFTLKGMPFILGDYTETGGGAEVSSSQREPRDRTTLRLGMSPGPDVFSGALARSYLFGHGFFPLGEGFRVFINAQAHIDRLGSGTGRLTGDMGLSFDSSNNPSQGVHLFLGALMADETTNSQTQSWWAASFHGRARPHNSRGNPLPFDIRFRLDAGRDSSGVGLARVLLGVTAYLGRGFEFRAQGSMDHSLDHDCTPLGACTMGALTLEVAVPFETSF